MNRTQISDLLSSVKSSDSSSEHDILPIPIVVAVTQRSS